MQRNLHGAVMSNLKEVPRTGYAVSNTDIAAYLHDLADNISRGDQGEVRQLVVVVEAAGELEIWVAGGPCDNARVVGLLTLAAFKQGAE